MGTMTDGISAVVLAYGEEAYLTDCVSSVLASGEVSELIVVDNGARVAVDALPPDARLRVLRPGTNLGFAGGCNYAVAHARFATIVFVNSDVRMDSAVPRILRDAVAPDEVGLACAQVRLGDEPDLLNSSGNPITYLMFSWAGNLGSPAVEHGAAGEVVGISGATFAIRHEVWEELGGFDETYFAYGEDMDLSLRAWLFGYRVRYEPAAVVWHYYEFSRNPLKMYLVERNRLITLFTVYRPETLRALAPAIVFAEVALLGASILGGWSRQKVDGWVWLWRNREYLTARRSAIYERRVRTDLELIAHLDTRVEPPPRFGMTVPGVVNRVFERSKQRVLRKLSAALSHSPTR